MKEYVDLMIINANELLTLRGHSKNPSKGAELRGLGIIEDGAIAVSQGKILAVGKTNEIKKKYTSEEIIDAKGKIVLPGFIDSHTHLIFAGSREEELTLKLEGATYLEILKRGGGILKTVRETRRAPISKLVELGAERLNVMMSHGVTTVEGKTGYGLNEKDEIKMLEAYKELDKNHPIEVISTLLAAHAIPPEYKDDVESYVELIKDVIIPKVGERKLAKFNDVFVEKGVFTYEQGKEILLAGREYDLVPKVHADEITDMGGAALAAEVGAISADHLARASQKGIKKMIEKNVIGVLLPPAPMVLMDYVFPKAREMIDLGLPIAIATDFNPNCWVENIQIAMFMATYFMRLTPAEVISAVTINAAHAIGLAEKIGSLEVGKQADIVVLDIPSHYWINYKFGTNLVTHVVKKGKIVVQRGKEI
ncbi:MAG: imidazolonepropionase [Candidatus Njordarchaeia archaeon]